MKIEKGAYAVGRGVSRTTNKNNQLRGSYSRFRTPIKEFLEPSLARRRVSEQLHRAADYLLDGDIGNFEVALTVASEWMRQGVWRP
jgi:hypothetical protein